MDPISADRSNSGSHEDPSLQDLLFLARELAQQAGVLAKRQRENVITRLATKSSPTDLVTEADKAAEHLIKEGIRRVRPYDAVLGEEQGEYNHPKGSRVRWIVDPIDGTVNYVYGYPQYAVSIAVEVAGQVVVGVVYNPHTDEQWHAVVGQGAWYGDKKLTGSLQTKLDQALVATGFSYSVQLRAQQGAVVAKLLPHIRDIRRAGACALDLCFAAQGRVDAYYERGVKLWDHAAGGLIAAEAGLLVTGMGGNPAGPDMVLVAPPVLHSQLDALLARIAS